MFKISNTTMSIIRGDSGEFLVNVTDDEGQDYTFEEGDILTFTVKKNTNTSDYLIQKTSTSGLFEIEPSDTNRLRYGSYKYDVQFSKENGYVDTIIGPADFIVLEEVTF